jgi:glycosyltransferase involved in cell wall biosynthesis
MPGLFIQKQAEAISSFCNVAVLYVHSDQHTFNRYEIDFAEESGVKVVRVYYREPEFPITAGMLKVIRFYKAHNLGFKMLRSFDPDVIHVHVLTREGIVAFVRKILHKTPYVITEHWSRYLPASDSFHGILRKAITRWVVRSSAAMIAVSETLKTAMLKFDLWNPEFYIVPNPVETSMFVPAEKRDIKSLKRFIHISCFEDRPKNISGFLNAVKSLSEKRSDFECYLIGDGPEFDLWKTRAEDLGLFNRIVYFTGLKEQEDLVHEIQQADFMVLSSNYETFGTVVIECLSCGIPVVATSVGIVPEVINQTNGIIVPPGNEEELESAINRMLDSCASYDPQVIRNSVVDKFDYKSFSARLMEIYQRSACADRKSIQDQSNN